MPLSAGAARGIQEVMQAMGDIVRIPREAEAPPDFTAFFAEEQRGLFKVLDFVTGNKTRDLEARPSEKASTVAPHANIEPGSWVA